MYNYKKKKMRHLSFTLFLALGLIACNTKQVDKGKISNDSIKTTISTSKTNFITSNSVDGVVIEENIKEFIAEVEKRYTVKKEKMQLEGDSYDIYNVYDKGKKIYSIEPYSDKPDNVDRIWIYGKEFKTEKGIGVGSTLADIKSKYNVESISTEGEGGLQILVKEISVGFIMDNSKLPKDWWGKMDNKEIPESSPIEEIIID
jgi:hypothetical protein